MINLLNDATLLTYSIITILSAAILGLFCVEIFRQRTYRLSFFFFSFLMTWGGIFLSSLVTWQCRYYYITDVTARDVMLDSWKWVGKDFIILVTGLATVVAIFIRISGNRTKD